jgi:hypothetical protein
MHDHKGGYSRFFGAIHGCPRLLAELLSECMICTTLVARQLTVAGVASTSGQTLVVDRQEDTV